MLGLVTLTHCLVISTLRLLNEKPRLRRGDIRHNWIAAENKWLAIRHGLKAIYIRTPGGKRRPLARDLEELLTRMTPIAAESAADSFLRVFQPIGKFETGAERQRRLYREKGDWKALVDDMSQNFGQEVERMTAGLK